MGCSHKSASVGSGASEYCQPPRGSGPGRAEGKVESQSSEVTDHILVCETLVRP